MDVKLDVLIEKLKQEGIDEGRQNADQIVKEAETKAGGIVEEARKQAEKIVADAKKQADQFEANSKLALQQAARDSELLLKAKITELFDRAFKTEIAESLDADFMKGIVLKLTEEWGEETAVEIVLNEADLKKLEGVLFSGVRKELKDSIILRPSADVSAGFRVGLKGEDMYHDFTDESIADVLKLFLKPQLKKILDGE